MKKVFYIIMCCGAMGLSLSSCIKDKLFNTPHPDKGAITIPIDFSNRSSESILPQTFIVNINGTEDEAETNIYYCYPQLLLPGNHSLMIYNRPGGIIVTGETATVDVLSDGSLNPMPGYFFSYACTLSVVADDTLRIAAKIKQQVRLLKLILDLPDASAMQQIASLRGTLSGVASALNMKNNRIVSLSGESVNMTFEKQEGSNEPILVASVRLMGVMQTEPQMLSLELIPTDGQRKIYLFDLTKQLENFNSDTDFEAFVVRGVFELSVQPGTIGTITDWEVENGGKIDLH